jgi:hypothetical protein
MWTWLSLGAAAVLFAAFGATQHRRAGNGKAPLIDLSLFRQRAFTFGLLAQSSRPCRRPARDGGQRSPRQDGGRPA